MCGGAQYSDGSRFMLRSLPLLFILRFNESVLHYLICNLRSHLQRRIDLINLINHRALATPSIEMCMY